MMGALWLSNHQLRNQVDIAYDRSLAGALRAIDHNISTASGGLAMEQPYLMLEFFELTANGSVFYRVATEDGLAEIGHPELPMPTQPLVSGEPQFFYATYLSMPVRVAALARAMDPPLYANKGGRVIVQVAEGLESRQAFLHQVLVRSVERDLAVILISVLVIILGVFMALRPLARLRQELERRPADDLSPVSASDLPGEVLPLVGAVNLHMARYAAQARVQSQFLDDASHQLRTPLSVLRTQTAYALRETCPQEVRTALLAMQEGLDRAVRTTNQMLALARAKDASLAEGGFSLEPVDLAALADGVIRSLLPTARARQMDIGLEADPGPAIVPGAEWLLREAVGNLVDNAIRYTSPAERSPCWYGASRGNCGYLWKTAVPACRPRTSPVPASAFAVALPARTSRGPAWGWPLSARSPKPWAPAWCWRTAPPCPGCAHPWCFPWNPPPMLRRVRKSAFFERC